MKKKTDDSEEAPGADSKTKTFDINQIREFVQRDLGVAITLLDAMYKDPATCNAVADFLFGRYMNSKHKEELDKQTKMPL